MNKKISKLKSSAIKIELLENKKQMGRAFLFLITNDLHKRPYGLMEDLFVSEKARGQGLGTSLVLEIIKTAKRLRCYKLIGTSRKSNEKVHKLYKRLGFKNHGFEFRMNFK